MFPVGIGLRDPRSQKRDLGHPSMFADAAHATELSALGRPVEHRRFRMVDSKVHFLSRYATNYFKSGSISCQSERGGSWGLCLCRPDTLSGVLPSRMS